MGYLAHPEELLLVDKEGTTRSPYLKEWVAWVDKFFDVDDAGVYLREIPNDDPVEDMPSRHGFHREGIN